MFWYSTQNCWVGSGIHQTKIHPYQQQGKKKNMKDAEKSCVPLERCLSLNQCHMKVLVRDANILACEQRGSSATRKHPPHSTSIHCFSDHMGSIMISRSEINGLRTVLNFHYITKTIRDIFRILLYVALIIFLLFLYCWDMRWVGTPEYCSQLYNPKCIHAVEKQKVGLRQQLRIYVSERFHWEFQGWKHCEITRCINTMSSVG